MSVTGGLLVLVGILLAMRGFAAVRGTATAGSSPSLALVGPGMAVLGLIMVVLANWGTAAVVDWSQPIEATPERAWSLLSSPALWSLQPGYFAFDVTDAGLSRLRVAMAIRSRSALGDVFEVTAEEPGRSLSLTTVGPGPPGVLALTLSVVPDGERRVTAVVRVRHTVRRGAAFDVRRRWRRRLKAWLAAARDVLEGRRPWPDEGPPADVRAACAKSDLRANSARVSANALLDAPPAAVWRTVYDPATTLRVHPEAVAAGHVPGTPRMAPGEMHYEIDRSGDGRLQPSLMVVLEVAEGRSAVARAVGVVPSETQYQIEPEDGGTRLTLTSRYPAERLTLNQQDQMASGIRNLVSRYQTLIEDTRPAG